MTKVNIETQNQTQVGKDFGHAFVQLPEPWAERIRIVSGMLVSRQSMICCNSSCIPGVWNRSSYQRSQNEGT